MKIKNGQSAEASALLFSVLIFTALPARPDASGPLIFHHLSPEAASRALPSPCEASQAA